MSKIRPEFLQRFYCQNKQSPSKGMGLRTLKVLEDNKVEDKVSMFVTNPKYTSEVDAIYQQTIGLDDEATSRQVQHMCTRSWLSKFDFHQESQLELEQDKERWRLLKMKRDLSRRQHESLASSALFGSDVVTVNWKAKSLPHEFQRMKSSNSVRQLDQCVYRYNSRYINTK